MNTIRSNISLALAIASVTLTGHAGAQSLTRAEVQAEYVRASDAGELNSTGYATAITGFPRTKSLLTRAEVIAELVRARAAGELNETGYETAVTTAPKTPSRLTRMEVIAEYVRANEAGELNQSGYPEVSAPNKSATPRFSGLGMPSAYN